MKRCPECQRTYSDTLRFCLDDGVLLTSKPMINLDESGRLDPREVTAEPAPTDVLGSAPTLILPRQEPADSARGQAQPPLLQNPPAQTPNWAQDWRGSYYQPPGPYHRAAQTGETKTLSLTSFTTGFASVLALTLIFLMYYNVIDPDREVLEICYYGSAALGVVAVVLGLLALIFRKQRSKQMAIVGLILGIPGIIFFLYIAIKY